MESSQDREVSYLWSPCAIILGDRFLQLFLFAVQHQMDVVSYITALLILTEVFQKLFEQHR